MIDFIRRVNRFIACLGLALVLGCGHREPQFTPIHGHYGVVSQWVGIDSGPGAKFFYRDDQGKLTEIWPFIIGTGSGVSNLYEKDMAIVTGRLPDKDGVMRVTRYYACDGPGPALDVSEDLLRLFCESNKLDFEKLRVHYSPQMLKEVAGGFQVGYLGDEGFPEGISNVTWDQLAEIIRDVKANGKRHKLWEHPVTYLRKDYGPLAWVFDEP